MFVVINIFALGRYDSPDYLAGYGLGSLTLTVASISVLVNLSAVSPLVGQANGSKDFRLARIYLHRQYFITIVAYVFNIIPYFWIHEIYIAIG